MTIVQMVQVAIILIHIDFSRRVVDVSIENLRLSFEFPNPKSKITTYKLKIYGENRIVEK